MPPNPLPAELAQFARPTDLPTGPMAQPPVAHLPPLAEAEVSSAMMQHVYEGAPKLQLRPEDRTFSDRDRDAFIDAMQQSSAPRQDLIDLLDHASQRPSSLQAQTAVKATEGKPQA